MEIRNLKWYIVLNCAIIPFLAAKPFSLNEALAAESKLKTSDISLPISTEPNPKRFSLIKDFPADTTRKHKLEKSLHEKLSPKKLKKRPKHKLNKQKHILSPLYLRRNSSKKRDTYKYDKKYFPVLKNLGLLLDNLLNSQPDDSYEISKNKQKRYKHKPEKRRGVLCKCALQSDTDTGESRTYEKTAVPPKTVSNESQATTTSAPDTAVGDVSPIRQNKELSLLFSRDPPSDRRDDDGHSEGSRAALHRSFQRNIPGNYGNSKHNSRFGDEESSAQSNEKATDGYSRDYASSIEYRRQNRGKNIPVVGRDGRKRKFFKDYETNHIFGGDSIEEHTRKNQFKAGRNQTKGENPVSEHVRRLRRPVPAFEDIPGSIGSEENDEKGVNDVSFDSTSDKRITSRSGTPATEAKEASSTNEDMISLKDLSNLDLALHKSTKIEAPSVTIIDGYSVARDKNGQNKLSEKTIHIHT